jgi:hypothetical protein
MLLPARYYPLTSLLRLSRPGFHEEWLRDEPSEATTTGPGSYIPAVWCQLSPGNGEHEIRGASHKHFAASFSTYREKRFPFIGTLFRLVLSYSQGE